MRDQIAKSWFTEEMGTTVMLEMREAYERCIEGLYSISQVYPETTEPITNYVEILKDWGNDGDLKKAYEECIKELQMISQIYPETLQPITDYAAALLQDAALSQDLNKETDFDALTKAELIDAYPEIDLNMKMKKADIIAAILEK